MCLFRQGNGEPVKLLGDDDLAAEARGAGQGEGKVEHVFLFLVGFRQFAGPGRVDDDRRQGAPVPGRLGLLHRRLKMGDGRRYAQHKQPEWSGTGRGRC